MSLPDRRARLDRAHGVLSIRRQCRLLGDERTRRDGPENNVIGPARELSGLESLQPAVG